jgi:hypothetical protein
MRQARRRLGERHTASPNPIVEMSTIKTSSPPTGRLLLFEP